jgi:hypothetical protein
MNNQKIKNLNKLDIKTGDDFGSGFVDSLRD